MPPTAVAPTTTAPTTTAPTSEPTIKPTEPVVPTTLPPTLTPSTISPSIEPTEPIIPTEEPTDVPTDDPIDDPTVEPTEDLSRICADLIPTEEPTEIPPILIEPEDFYPDPETLVNITTKKSWYEGDFILRGLPKLKEIRAGGNFYQNSPNVSLTCR